MAENEVSCYATHVLIKYAEEQGLSDITRGVPESIEKLNSPQEWTTAENWTLLARNIEIALGDTPGILQSVVQKIISSENRIVFILFLKILPIHTLVNTISNLTKNYSNKNLSIKVKPDGTNRWVFTVSRLTPGHFSRQMCDFNRGAAYAYFSMKRFTAIHIQEKCCIPRDGADSCTYLIEGTPPKSLLQKAKNRLFFLFNNQAAVIEHLEANQRELRDHYRELVTTKDFYSHIMMSMSEAIVWLSADGIITFANKAFSVLTGTPADTAVGSRFEACLKDDASLARFQKLCCDVRKEPATPFEAEFSYTSDRPDATIGATTLRWVPGEHHPPGFIISIRDISDKRIIERQLSAAEDRYRSLYENSPAIIIAMNLAGNFIYANPAMTEQSGYSEAELVTMHFKELVAPRADYNVDHLLTGLLSSPTRLQEVHFKTKSGEWKCVALNTYHLTGPGGDSIGIAGIGIDITETKRLNEQIIRTQRMDLLGQLAGGLAHDFGNVITSINGFSKLIETKTTDEKIKRYAVSIDKAGHRAHDLVKSLLAFSRNDEAETVPFDIVPIVDEVRDMLHGATGANVSIHATLPEDPLYMLGDPGKIHQCVLNLCINARDAIGDEQGSITLVAEKAASESGTDRVIVKVIDTGSGIPPHILEKIYDPFFSTKEKRAGTGLGLSVVYGIIKSHGGEITVDSHPGEGTAFSLEFPCSKPPI